MPLSLISPFANKNGIIINVFAIEDGKHVVFPLCATDDVVAGKHVDLLLHEMGGGGGGYTTLFDYTKF